MINLWAVEHKRELRGAWIATVKNIDWPSSPESDISVQKAELISILVKLHEVGINTIFFQVRTECDALYESQIEPWSYWLTGKQGMPPKTLFDPLNFIIKEAHNRGMEIHAWINPLRAGAQNSEHKTDSSHVSITHPGWILETEQYLFLNPGIDEVRNYTISIVKDIVRRYDIDGVHFDDYFYPYTGMKQEDIQTYRGNPRGFDNIEDWRRDNVNLLIRDVHSGIKSIKPYVKFGISPFGIWKDGVPSGTTGISSYHNIFCDPIEWLDTRTVDYIVPQLYWEIGGEQDYSKLANWWAELSNERHVYTGNALYKMNDVSRNWSSEEIANQIRINRDYSNIKGCVFFRTSDIVNNVKGITDIMKNQVFSHKTLIPGMSWIDSIPPLFPFNLTAASCADGILLNWHNPVSAIDDDLAKYNVIYRFDTNEADTDNPGNILDIVGAYKTSYTDTTGIPNHEYMYRVTALDKMQNESIGSNIIQTNFTQIESHIGLTPQITQLYPPEFTPSRKYTRIKFSIGKEEMIKLSIFDGHGKKIITLVDEELLPGNYSVKYKILTNARNSYHCNLSTPTFSDMKPIKLVQNKKRTLQTGKE